MDPCFRRNVGLLVPVVRLNVDSGHNHWMGRKTIQKVVDNSVKTPTICGCNWKANLIDLNFYRYGWVRFPCMQQGRYRSHCCWGLYNVHVYRWHLSSVECKPVGTIWIDPFQFISARTDKFIYFVCCTIV